MMRTVALSLALCCLSACALPPAPVDHYYRLRIGPIDRRFDTPRIDGTLRIDRPRAEALTDGTNLIYRRESQPSEVHRDPYQYWSDAPSLIVGDVLIDAFHSSGIASRVVPAGLRSPVDFTLSSRIVKMERIVATLSETVVLDFEFSLTRERDRKLLFHRRYEDREAVDGSGAAEAVEAYDRAMARILDALLRDLGQTLSADEGEAASWRP